MSSVSKFVAPRMSSIDYSLKGAFDFVLKLETVYRVHLEIRRTTSTFNISDKYSVDSEVIYLLPRNTDIFSALRFSPGNCYPEMTEKFPNDDMWFGYDEKFKDDAYFQIPASAFSTEDFTEEWWFQQSLVHKSCDLFFYVVFHLLYKNQVLKDHVYFSCTVLDDLYNEIIKFTNIKPI